MTETSTWSSGLGQHPAIIPGPTRRPVDGQTGGDQCEWVESPFGPCLRLRAVTLRFHIERVRVETQRRDLGPGVRKDGGVRVSPLAPPLASASVHDHTSDHCGDDERERHAEEQQPSGQAPQPAEVAEAELHPIGEQDDEQHDLGEEHDRVIARATGSRPRGRHRRNMRPRRGRAPPWKGCCAGRGPAPPRRRAAPTRRPARRSAGCPTGASRPVHIVSLIPLRISHQFTGYAVANPSTMAICIMNQ